MYNIILIGLHEPPPPRYLNSFLKWGHKDKAYSHRLDLAKRKDYDKDIYFFFPLALRSNAGYGLPHSFSF
jgi:hypothetical protein